MAEECNKTSFSEPCWVLDGSTVAALRKRLHIYVWKWGSEALYVGLTGVGMSRVFGHNIIGRTDPVADGDVIEFHDCGTTNWEEAAHLEQELIDQLRPRYNKTIPASADLQQLICQGCGEMFMQKRSWQRWCSKACRNGRPRAPETPEAACPTGK